MSVRDLAIDIYTRIMADRVDELPALIGKAAANYVAADIRYDWRTSREDHIRLIERILKEGGIDPALCRTA